MSHARSENTNTKKRRRAEEQDSHSPPAKKQKLALKIRFNAYENSSTVIAYYAKTNDGMRIFNIRCFTAIHVRSGVLIQVVSAADVCAAISNNKHKGSTLIRSFVSHEKIGMRFPTGQSGYCLTAAGLDKLLEIYLKKPHDIECIAWLASKIRPILHGINIDNMFTKHLGVDHLRNIEANHQTTSAIVMMLARKMSEDRAKQVDELPTPAIVAVAIAELGKLSAPRSTLLSPVPVRPLQCGVLFASVKDSTENNDECDSSSSHSPLSIMCK